MLASSFLYVFSLIILTNLNVVDNQMLVCDKLISPEQLIDCRRKSQCMKLLIIMESNIEAVRYDIGRVIDQAVEHFMEVPLLFGLKSCSLEVELDCYNIEYF